MVKNEQAHQSNEQIEENTPPPEAVTEPVASTPDQSAPRQLSEDKKHRREEIIHDFYVRRRLGRLGLTIAERRARRAMRSPSGPRSTGNKRDRSRLFDKPPENSHKEE